MKVLEGFHHQLDQKIVGILYWKVREGVWERSLVAEALEATVMWPLKEFIQRPQTTSTEYITNHPIYELCTGADRI